MPTYEYECQKCGHRLEEFQSMTAKPLVRCPKCKGKLKRLIGAGAGFLFKGSGFYITDYRNSSYKEKQKSDTSAGEKSGDKSGEKSGDKSPAKADAAGGAKAESSAPLAKPKDSPKSKAAGTDTGGKKAKRD
jgi:putative FmdB family regulatory protein